MRAPPFLFLRHPTDVSNSSLTACLANPLAPLWAFLLTEPVVKSHHRGRWLETIDWERLAAVSRHVSRHKHGLFGPSGGARPDPGRRAVLHRDPVTSRLSGASLIKTLCRKKLLIRSRLMNPNVRFLLSGPRGSILA